MPKTKFGAALVFYDEPRASTLANTNTKRRALIKIHALGERFDGQVGKTDFWHGFWL